MLTTDLLHALGGGLLIGGAVALLWLKTGQIAGISGITSGAIFGQSGDRAWRWWFIGGLLLGAAVYRLANGSFIIDLQANPIRILLAGLLVGLGSRIGNGCTSGHGVCGIARGSKRSFIATLLFIGMGILVVYVDKHLGGIPF